MKYLVCEDRKCQYYKMSNKHQKFNYSPYTMLCCTVRVTYLAGLSNFFMASGEPLTKQYHSCTFALALSLSLSFCDCDGEDVRWLTEVQGGGESKKREVKKKGNKNAKRMID
jgi:hypothetical protein